MNLPKQIPMGVSLLLGTGCTTIHSVQLGNIDSQTLLTSKPFEIKVNEIGVNTEDAVAIAETIATATGHGEEVSTIGDIIELFQMGPRTGNPVFNVQYSDKIAEKLTQECPSGRITGLMSIRETAEYPVISGEIVRLVGYCMKD